MHRCHAEQGECKDGFIDYNVYYRCQCSECCCENCQMTREGGKFNA